jgi:hypothetical protein
MEKSLLEKIRDEFVERVLGLFLLGFGVLFLYAPIDSLLDIHAKSKILTETERADLDSITQNLDPSAMSEAVQRLMARADVKRVRVLRGEVQYPEFDIFRGKNVSPGDIGRAVEVKTNGYWIWIGYSSTDAAASAKSREINGTITSIGSLTLGGCLFVCGLIQLFRRAKAPVKPLEETPRKRQPAPPAPEPSEPEPVRYDGLKIVKGGR